MFCPSKDKQSGFTLIEMLVVVSIFLITTGIVLANFPKFREKSSLDLLAREIALTVRQAQVYGTATKRHASEGSGSFPSYGLRFRAAQTSFLLFADKNGNSIKDDADSCAAGTECVEQFNLYGGAKVLEVKGRRSGLAAEEVILTSARPSYSFHLTFPRPNANAVFCRITVGAPVCVTYDYVKIVIEKGGEKRNIIVWSTGHIYVESDLAS